MTTMLSQDATCAVCGTVSTQEILMSTSSFGASDLDLRPPPLARETLSLEVQRCPSCGYRASNLEEASAEAGSVVESDGYRRQAQDPRFTPLANDFLCLAMLHEASGDRASAGLATLRAAWACDDAGNEEAADTVRGLTADHLRAAQPEGARFARDPATETCLLVDVLRRCGRFHEARAELDRVDMTDADDLTRQILRFQRKLVDAADRSRYTVADASGQTPPR